MNQLKEKAIKSEELLQNEKKVQQMLNQEEKAKNQSQSNTFAKSNKREEKKEIVAKALEIEKRKEEKKFVEEEFGKIDSNSKRSIDSLVKEGKFQEHLHREETDSNKIKSEKEKPEQFGSESSVKSQKKDILSGRNTDLLNKEKNNILEAERNLDKFLEEEKRSPLWSDKRRSGENRDENSNDKYYLKREIVESIDFEKDESEEIADQKNKLPRMFTESGGISTSQANPLDPLIDDIALEDFDHIEPVEEN